MTQTETITVVLIVSEMQNVKENLSMLILELQILIKLRVLFLKQLLNKKCHDQYFFITMDTK